MRTTDFFAVLRTRFWCRVFIGIAALAILIGAVAPAISHVLSGEKTGWLEVCTAQGFKRVLSATDAGSPVDRDVSHVVHCPFCVPNATSFGLVPAEEFVFIGPSSLPRFYPPRFFSVPHRLFVWTSSNPRAPPSFSA